MKNSILLILIFFSLKTFAQSSNYNDLLLLYVDGDYKKLVAKAEKYTLKDNTKNDAYPYYWTGKGLFKISFQNETDETFKNAYKESLGFFAKCIKKDKSGEVFAKEKDFFLEVKGSLIELTINEVTTNNHKNALNWIKKLYTIFPNDITAKYMEAVCLYNAKDTPGANKIWTESQKEFEQIQAISTWTPKEREFLKFTVIQTIVTMKTAGKTDLAKTFAQKANLWFEKDELFIKEYSSLMN